MRIRFKLKHLLAGTALASCFFHLHFQAQLTGEAESCALASLRSQVSNQGELIDEFTAVAEGSYLLPGVVAVDIAIGSGRGQRGFAMYVFCAFNETHVIPLRTNYW